MSDLRAQLRAGGGEQRRPLPWQVGEAVGGNPGQPDLTVQFCQLPDGREPVVQLARLQQAIPGVPRQQPAAFQIGGQHLGHLARQLSCDLHRCPGLASVLVGLKKATTVNQD